MLVDNMSHSEIRKELIDDFFESIISKKNGLDKKYKHFTLKNKEKDKETIAGLHYYFTKRRNNWLVIVYVQDKSLTYGYICVRPTSYGEICYVISCNELLEKDYLPSKMVIHEYTPHFFDRYKERINIDFQRKSYEHYFMYNNYGEIYENEQKGGSNSFVKTAHGYSLGYSSLNEKYYKYNTFITASMLGKNQCKEYSDSEIEYVVIRDFMEIHNKRNP